MELPQTQLTLPTVLLALFIVWLALLALYGLVWGLVALVKACAARQPCARPADPPAASRPR